MLYQAQEELYGWRPVFEMPVQLSIDFSDGSDTTITVWNDEQLQQFEFNLDKEVVFVSVDPDKWILRKSYYKPDLPVSVNEITTEYDIKLFPNPVANVIYADVLSEAVLPFQFSIYNLSGKQIISLNINTKMALINIEELKSGLYFYSISSEELSKPLTGKIIKE